MNIRLHETHYSNHNADNCDEDPDSRQDIVHTYCLPRVFHFPLFPLFYLFCQLAVNMLISHDQSSYAIKIRSSVLLRKRYT